MCWPSASNGCTCSTNSGEASGGKFWWYCKVFHCQCQDTCIVYMSAILATSLSKSLAPNATKNSIPRFRIWQRADVNDVSRKEIKEEFKRDLRQNRDLGQMPIMILDDILCWPDQGTVIDILTKVLEGDPHWVGVYILSSNDGWCKQGICGYSEEIVEKLTEVRARNTKDVICQENAQQCAEGEVSQSDCESRMCCCKHNVGGFCKKCTLGRLESNMFQELLPMVKKRSAKIAAKLANVKHLVLVGTNGRDEAERDTFEVSLVERMLAHMVDQQLAGLFEEAVNVAWAEDFPQRLVHSRKTVEPGAPSTRGFRSMLDAVKEKIKDKALAFTKSEFPEVRHCFVWCEKDGEGCKLKDKDGKPQFMPHVFCMAIEDRWLLHEVKNVTSPAVQRLLENSGSSLINYARNILMQQAMSAKTLTSLARADKVSNFGSYAELSKVLKEQVRRLSDFVESFEAKRLNTTCPGEGLYVKQITLVEPAGLPGECVNQGGTWGKTHTIDILEKAKACGAKPGCIKQHGFGFRPHPTKATLLLKISVSWGSQIKSVGNQARGLFDWATGQVATNDGRPCRKVVYDSEHLLQADFDFGPLIPRWRAPNFEVPIPELATGTGKLDCHLQGRAFQGLDEKLHDIGKSGREEL